MAPESRGAYPLMRNVRVKGERGKGYDAYFSYGIRSCLSIKRLEGLYEHYVPEETHFGAVTVGGVTVGGTYTTGGYTQERIEDSGHGQLMYFNMSRIDYIQLSDSLAQKAKYDDSINARLRGNRIILMNDLSMYKDDASLLKEALLHKMDYPSVAALEHIIDFLCDSKTVKSDSWLCECGNKNPGYLSTCTSCGKSRKQ